MQQEILRKNEVLRVTGVSLATIYRWMQEGHFPRNVKLGPRAAGWRRADIERWLAERGEGVCHGN